MPSLEGTLHQISPTLESMQDNVSNEVLKIQVTPAFRGFVLRFPNYFLSNTERAYVPN